MSRATVYYSIFFATGLLLLLLLGYYFFVLQKPQTNQINNYINKSTFSLDQKTMDLFLKDIGFLNSEGKIAALYSPQRQTIEKNVSFNSIQINLYPFTPNINDQNLIGQRNIGQDTFFAYAVSFISDTTDFVVTLYINESMFNETSAGLTQEDQLEGMIFEVFARITTATEKGTQLSQTDNIDVIQKLIEYGEKYTLFH